MLAHSDHAGVGTLDLVGPRGRLARWRYTLARQPAALRLQKAGVTLAPNSTPRAVATQLAAQRDANDPRVAALLDWLLRLEEQRYAAPPQRGGSLATLQAEFKQLQPVTRSN